MDPTTPGIYWRLSGAWQQHQDVVTYDDWAVVERSGPNEIVLYADVAAGAASAAASGASHCVIQSKEGLPNLTVGSKIWLQLVQHQQFDAVPRANAEGNELTLRTGEHGPALLSSVVLPVTTESESPKSKLIQLDKPMEVCSRPERSCLKDGVETVYSLELHADTAKRLQEGAHQKITLDGVAYDVWLRTARKLTGTMVECSDFFIDPWIWTDVELRALEPQTLTAQLTRGDLPACSMGNDPGVYYDHTITAHDLLETIESPVAYHGVRESSLTFDLVGDPQSGMFELDQSAPIAKPRPGQTYWLSSTYWFFVLRASKSGPILLASGSLGIREDGLQSELEGGAVERVSAWLGVPVSIEPQCSYESTPAEDASSLYRARIGAGPGTQIPNGTSARVQIDGRDYDFWLRNDGEYVNFTLTPAG